MRLIASAVALLFATGLCQPTWAGPEEEVHARFEEWIRTYNTNDADRLSQLYDQNARLLATRGNEKPIDGRDAIRACFAPNFKRGPQADPDGHTGSIVWGKATDEGSLNVGSTGAPVVQLFITHFGLLWVRS